MIDPKNGTMYTENANPPIFSPIEKPDVSNMIVQTCAKQLNNRSDWGQLGLRTFEMKVLQSNENLSSVGTKQASKFTSKHQSSHSREQNKTSISDITKGEMTIDQNATSSLKIPERVTRI